jgi:hypothetical protein
MIPQVMMKLRNKLKPSAPQITYNGSFSLILIMQYRKKTQPPSSINEISAIHASTNLKGFKNGISCNLYFLSMIIALSFSINLLLQHVAIQRIREMAIEAAENGNI